MQKIIIIKYGELTTKKDNLNFFLKTLAQNITKTLGTLATNVYFDTGRMFVEAKEENISPIIEKLSKIFGIHEIILGYKDADMEMSQIKANSLALLLPLFG